MTASFEGDKRLWGARLGEQALPVCERYDAIVFGVIYEQGNWANPGYPFFRPIASAYEQPRGALAAAV
ncbi:MAG: hypothetical protein ACI8W8_004483 [Rhodothermales bacterium]|jgi:hypothetical protein